MLDSILDWILDHIVLSVGIFTITLLALTIPLALKENREWAEYSKSHHCITAGTIQGEIAYGIGHNGYLVTTLDRDRVIYRCDGGEIVIR